MSYWARSALCNNELRTKRDSHVRGITFACSAKCSQSYNPRHSLYHEGVDLSMTPLSLNWHTYGVLVSANSFFRSTFSIQNVASGVDSRIGFYVDYNYNISFTKPAVFSDGSNDVPSDSTGMSSLFTSIGENFRPSTPKALHFM